MDHESEIELARRALQARENSYAPYSRYRVGCALLSKSGRLFLGCNVENAAYPLCICAERTAICSMVVAGEQEIAAIAVACDGGGTPCGACRQTLAEFPGEYPILIVDSASPQSIPEITKRYTIAELLPDAFEL